MNPIERLEFYKDQYTVKEVSIYNWVKENPNELIRLPIEIIAKYTHTSKAAIIRFSKKIGYKGFAEFKFELSRFIISGERQDEDKDDIDTITSITSLYEGYLRQMKNSIQLEEIKRIVDCMIKANRIKIIGNNRSGLSALQLRLRLSKIGMDAEAITDMILLTSTQYIFKKGDYIILFSTYANSQEYVDFTKTVHENGAKICLITVNINNKISKYCDEIICLPCISKASFHSFYDDQPLFFIFIEILLAELAYKIKA